MCHILFGWLPQANLSLDFKSLNSRYFVQRVGNISLQRAWLTPMKEDKGHMFNKKIKTYAAMKTLPA